jgi:hypothetical protein
MKRWLARSFGIAVMMLFLVTAADAHTPLCACYDNGDGTITCEGGFSDGSSGAGVAMKVQDRNGKLLKKGKMNEDSEFTFKKPGAPYTVIFDAGPGHAVEVKSENITE